MRWLIFLDTDHLSGPARLALDFAVDARRAGQDVLILGLVRGRRPEPTAFSRAVEAAGVPLRMLHERFRFDPATVGQFERLLAEFRPDIYQSHGYKGSLLGLRARRQGIAWQALFHGFTWENWRVRLYHRLDVRWLRRADEVIAVSRAFSATLAREGVDPARLRWVPNAIDEQALRATETGAQPRGEWLAELGAPPGAILAGVIGRFSPEKAPGHFLDVLAAAAPRDPRLHAVMIGDGPELEASRRRAKSVGLERRVLFPGFRSDLAAVYRALDMLVIPSRSEGLPTVLVEALLMGVPVVSTAVGAVPDILADGRTGLIVPVGDVPALAAAMLRLAADRDLRVRLAEAGGELARRRLTLARRTATLVEHAEALIAGAPIPEVPWEDAP